MVRGPSSEIPARKRAAFIGALSLRVRCTPRRKVAPMTWLEPNPLLGRLSANTASMLPLLPRGNAKGSLRPVAV